MEKERVSKEDNDKFYRTMIAWEMKEWEEGKSLLPMTIGDAEFLYQFGISTIYKNGKVKFINE